LVGGGIGVSEETIRRDVRQLEHSGHLVKNHGGISLPGRLTEGRHRARMRENTSPKQRIGHLAARQVVPGMVLLLDAGTTTVWAARALQGIKDITIITNSIEVAREVVGRPGQRLFMAGGAINGDFHAAFGPEAVAYCRNFVPDITMVSMGAITAEGFFDFDSEEALFKRPVMGLARRVMVLADASKFGKAAHIPIASYAQVHDVVTDAAPPPDIAAAATQNSTQIHIAT